MPRVWLICDAVATKPQAADGLHVSRQYMLWDCISIMLRQSISITYSYYHSTDCLKLGRLMKWQIGENGLKIVPADNSLRLEVGLLTSVCHGVFTLSKHPIEPPIHNDEISMSHLAWRIHVEEIIAEGGCFIVPKEPNSSVLCNTIVRGM
jgi:hypothetical protein